MPALSFILTIVILVANWMIYKKMGYQGWEGIIPFYNTYILCKALYDNGWKMLLLLVPIYNIIFAIKMNIDLAKAFNKTTGFGIGLIFLSPIFLCLLGFGDAQYGDGSCANSGSDFVSDTVSKVSDVAGNVGKAKADTLVEKLVQTVELKNQGVLTYEEYMKLKDDLVNQLMNASLAGDPYEQLRKLSELKDAGAIDVDDFARVKASWLSKM